MSYTFRTRLFEVEVADEEPMSHVNIVGGQQFIPAWCKIVFFDDSTTRIDVQGPLIGKGGKVMKKFGLASFDRQDVADGDAPQWLIDLMKELG